MEEEEVDEEDMEEYLDDDDEDYDEKSKRKSKRKKPAKRGVAKSRASTKSSATNSASQSQAINKTKTQTKTPKGNKKPALKLKESEKKEIPKIKLKPGSVISGSSSLSSTHHQDHSTQDSQPRAVSQLSAEQKQAEFDDEAEPVEMKEVKRKNFYCIGPAGKLEIRRQLATNLNPRVVIPQIQTQYGLDDK